MEMIFDGILLVIVFAQGMFIWNLLTFKKILSKEVESLGKALEYHRGMLSSLMDQVKEYQKFSDEMFDEITKLHYEVDETSKNVSSSNVRMEKGLC